MAYSRQIFTTDSQRVKFSVFQKPEISKTKLRVTTTLQLLSIFLMVRVVMLVSGITFVNVPLVDEVLVNCISLLA